MRICVSVDLDSVIEETSAVFRQVSHFVAPESQSTPISGSYGSVPVQASLMQQSACSLSVVALVVGIVGV